MDHYLTDDEISSNATTSDQIYNILLSDPKYQLSKILGKYILIVIYIVGTVCNGLSIAVIIRRPTKESSVAQVVLAVADNLVLLTGCLRRWIYEITNTELLDVSAFTCYLINVLTYCSTDMAVWIAVIKTVDRVIVVTSPLKVRIYITNRRTVTTIIVLALVIATKNVHFFFTTHYEHNVCTVKGEYKPMYYRVWSWINSSSYCFVPFSLLLTFNIVIIITLIKASRRRDQMLSTYVKERSKDFLKSIGPRKQAINLFSVSFTSILLISPVAIVDILRSQGKPYLDWKNPTSIANYLLIKQLSQILAYTYHSVNIFMYGVSGTRFRRELKKMFCHKKLNQQQHYLRRISQISGKECRFAVYRESVKSSHPLLSRTTTQT